MELREFIKAEIRAHPNTEHATHLRSVLGRYDIQYPHAEPVTLETLPGELEKLGFEKCNFPDYAWVEFRLYEGVPDGYEPWREIMVRFDDGSIIVRVTDGEAYECEQVSFERANPADALELVKLLVEGAERG